MLFLLTGLSCFIRSLQLYINIGLHALYVNGLEHFHQQICVDS
jgi:hypothetical protein